MKRPELLLPASGPEVLRIAAAYGADAVYLGGQAFSLRARAGNFTWEEMAEGIAFAHARNVRVYVTANILAHQADLAEAESYFSRLAELSPDGVLIADPGLFRIARRVSPGLSIHISTQANNTNAETFLFWYELGVRRIVCARELTLAEIGQIRAQVPADMEIEAFVHGAMCISYSGRCLLSSYFTGRNANRGECTHPCRWEYALMEQTRPGAYLPVMENERGTFIFNSRDLCMIDHLPEMIDAGIDSLKIEGRMKNALYVATMARAYRSALDTCLSSPDAYEKQKAAYVSLVSECTHRPYGSGFYFGRPDASGMIYGDSTYEKAYTYLGYVEEVRKDGFLCLTQKNKFCVGETIELITPSGNDRTVRVRAMQDEKGGAMESCPHAGERFWVDIGCDANRYDILRRRNAYDVKHHN